MFPLGISGSVLPEYAQCPKCGAQPYLLQPLGNLATMLLVERAKQELANGDITVTILLCAIAVEGEMAYLFFKWKGIDSGILPSSLTQGEPAGWEGEWKNMSSFRGQLDALSKFLTSKTFDEFALQNKAWLMPALDGFDPATSIKEYFQKRFYDTRIRVVHYGEIDFEEPDGELCFSLASALLKLLHAMDMKRCQTMDEAHKKLNSQLPVAPSTRCV
jgi:hypothetical protein